jgi:hypothetical protein
MISPAIAFKGRRMDGLTLPPRTTTESDIGRRVSPSLAPDFRGEAEGDG